MEILRLIIETRKDRGSVVPVTFRDRGAKVRQTVLVRGPAVSLFRKPDGIHGLTAWRRMIREDLYVLDAPTVYMDRDRRGNVIGFDIIDGATIKVVPDNWGRLPREGNTAFQQVLRGVPAVDYDARDIVYAPRNPRPHKFYGFSPVEQIVVYIDTYIRRMLGQRNHFTEGNIPEMLIACPETWQPAQVKEMQRVLGRASVRQSQGPRWCPLHSGRHEADPDQG